MRLATDSVLETQAAEPTIDDRDRALPVLVVLDHAETRQVIIETLRHEADLTAREATSLAEAEALLGESAVAAVVLDLHLADGDALAMVADLASRQVRPVVVLVEPDAMRLAARALRAGAADYVVKGAGYADLLVSVVWRTIETTRATAAARAHRAQLEALMALNQLKSTFIARVSHELRTPLTYVLGYAELLHERTFESEQVQDFAGDILQAARHLVTLVEALLAVGEHQRSGYAPVCQELRLADEVRQAWAVAPANPRHRLVCQIDDDASVWADRDLLAQVLGHLLGNACQYSPDGGRIVVGRREQAGGVRISIEDQGMGFDPSLAERLFEPLFRVESDATHHLPGLGLGLTAARAIVASHQGWIRAHSEGPGRGACFDLWLPHRRGD